MLEADDVVIGQEVIVTINDGVRCPAIVVEVSTEESFQHCTTSLTSLLLSLLTDDERCMYLSDESFSQSL